MQPHPQRSVLRSLGGLVGILAVTGGLGWTAFGHRPTLSDPSAHATAARTELLRAEHARLGSLVAGPTDVGDLHAAFTSSIRHLDESATDPGATFWSEPARTALEQYGSIGEQQFQALEQGDLPQAMQIAGTDGVTRSDVLSTILAAAVPAPSHTTGNSDRAAAFAAVAGLALIGLSRVRRRTPDRDLTPTDLLTILHEPSVITDGTGAVLAATESIAAMFAMSSPDLARMLPPADLGTALTLGEQVLRTGETAVLQWTGPVHGAEAHVETTISRAKTQPRHTLVWTFRDLTDQKRTEGELVQKAFHDSLTGLPNRALFRERTVEALARAPHTDMVVSVLFIDLDGFKNVNDSLGHDAGDELIIDMANRLRTFVRSSDTLCRMGGDEFAVLIEDPRSKLADFLAERMLVAIRQPIRIRGQEVFVGASIGIAEASPDINTEELLRNADTAMYAAKDRGKNRVVRFHAMMFQEATERLELDSELRRAIELNQLRLHYQPIVSLKDNRMVATEALLRWFHPTRGVVPPDIFIPIAEETGSIVEIGRWVVRTAIRQAASMSTDMALGMHVNVSARQLQDERLLQIVADELAANDVDPSRLTLEITESVFLDDIEATIVLLEQFTALGVRLAIDDFGTGYSSLSYLHRLPVQSVKIDRSFIADRPTRAELEADPFVLAILTLARTLGFESVAEGIESDEQLQWLTEHGCDLGQGYFFARPLPVESLQGAIRTLAPPPHPTPELEDAHQREHADQSAAEVEPASDTEPRPIADLASIVSD